MLTQTGVKQINDLECLLDFKQSELFHKFMLDRSRVRALFTGNQYGKCVSITTKISTPDGDKTVGELLENGLPFLVYSYKDGEKITAVALPPFKKTKREPCVRVTMSDGGWFEAALGHRVLTADGWVTVSFLLSEHQQESFSSPPVSSSGLCRLVRASDGLRCSRKSADCPGDCSADYRLSGGQPLSDVDTDLAFLPLPIDVQRRNYFSFCSGVSEKIHTYTLCLWSILLSSLGGFPRSLGQFCLFLAGAFCKEPQSSPCVRPSSVQRPTGEVLIPQSEILNPQCQSSSSLASLPPPVLINGNSIVSYEFISCQDVYDFTVPETGNYYAAGVVHHNTSGVAYEYVLRILGIHPVPKRNVEYMECSSRVTAMLVGDDEWKAKHGGEFDLSTWQVGHEPQCCPWCAGKITRHKRRTTAFRFASETLPGMSANTGDSGGSAETKNTQYPAFKKWLPAFLLKRDVSVRFSAMIIANVHGGDDIVIDFISYNQDVQSTAGTQRLSVWYDEEPPKEMRTEQRPRLFAEDGDEVFTLTPANHISWLHDDIYEKASRYYRTDHIVNFLKSPNYTPAKYEEVPGNENIAVFQAATDDNPTLSPAVIEELFSGFDDPDVVAIRRYGIFKQVSGRIFKDFDYSVHVIDEEKYFPDTVPSGWVWARGIDYHPRTPWGFAAVALSPDNEAFVVYDWEPNPEKLTIHETAKQISDLGGSIKFRLNLIDPLSDATMMDTKSLLHRFNDYFYDFKREHNQPEAYWRKWDTKGELGRDAIRERLKNSKICREPFNNKTLKDGREIRLPTLWVVSRAKIVAKCMKQWRWEEYADAKSRQTKGIKNTPEQKFSHHCMVLEAIFKENAFRPQVDREQKSWMPPTYFKGVTHGRR